MARPRKPTKILQFTGAFDKNPQRGRARANEPNLPAGLGEPPEWMDTPATEEWKRVAPDLEAAGVTSRVESTALAVYCQAVSRMRLAEKEIFRDGITIMTEGGLKKHPAVGIAERAAVIIKAFASEFGMTPASRSKVSAKPGTEQNPDNEFASA